MRIEVGRGLEPQMTDLMSGLIIRNVILPAFRRGDFSGGVRAGVHDIRDVLLGDAEEVKRRAQGGSKRSTGDDNIWPFLIFFGLFVAFFTYASWQQQQQLKNLSPRERYRRAEIERRARRDSGTNSNSGGSSGGWTWTTGSGSSGGGSSDSGWSGGGGDFGGGGASGDW